MVSDLIRPDDPFFAAGPADYEDVKARFVEDGHTWAPQHAHDVEVLLTEVTRRVLRDSGESFDAALGARLGEAYGNRLMEHMEELEAIVRDLAEFDPAPRSNAYYCSMCGEHTADDISLHTEGCAYARAVMWVAAHPAPGTETET